MTKIISNPFRMFGSYAGAVIFSLFPLFSKISCSIAPSGDILSLRPLIYCLSFIQFPIIGITLGFLVGWGIHSLIKRIFYY